MIVAALVLGALAALLHVYIFVLESIGWTGPRARRTFGTTLEQAAAQKELAFNQGFYNLFLALAVFIGIVAWIAGAEAIGATLVFAGAGSMLGAALVLVLRNASRARAALVQGTLPALTVAALAIGLALR